MRALYRITARHLCAGVITDSKGFIIKAAPILKWSTQRHISKLLSYAESKGWRYEVVEYLA